MSDIKWSPFFQALVIEQAIVLMLYIHCKIRYPVIKKIEADIWTWYSFGNYDRWVYKCPPVFTAIQIRLQSKRAVYFMC